MLFHRFLDGLLYLTIVLIVFELLAYINLWLDCVKPFHIDRILLVDSLLFSNTNMAVKRFKFDRFDGLGFIVETMNFF